MFRIDIKNLLVRGTLRVGCHRPACPAAPAEARRKRSRLSRVPVG
jgi:hypothetical protein